jgi:hypothetical protein
MKRYISRTIRTVITGAVPTVIADPCGDPAIAAKSALAVNGNYPTRPANPYALIIGAGRPINGNATAAGPVSGLSLVGNDGFQSFNVLSAVSSLGMAYYWGSLNSPGFPLFTKYYPSASYSGNALGLDGASVIQVSGINTSSQFPNGDENIVVNNPTDITQLGSAQIEKLISTAVIKGGLSGIQTAFVSGVLSTGNISTQPYPGDGSVLPTVTAIGVLKQLFIVEVDDNIDSAANQAGNPLYWIINNTSAGLRINDPTLPPAQREIAPIVQASTDFSYAQNQVNNVISRSTLNVPLKKMDGSNFTTMTVYTEMGIFNNAALGNNLPLSF